jgi:hypothetical protein
MAANGNLIFQDTNKATFVGANSNVVIDTVHASFGIGVDVNGPTSNLHVVGNAYVSSNLHVVGNAYVSSNLTVTGNTFYTNPTAVLVDSNVVTEYTGPHDRPLRKYPEVAIINGTLGPTGGIVQTPGVSESQRGYTVTSSSSWGVGGTDTRAAWCAFDEGKSTTTYKIWQSGNYYTTATPGLYNRSPAQSHTANGVNYEGEWIKLELPRKINISKIEINATAYSSLTGHVAGRPYEGAILGSNDDSTWSLLKSFSGGLSWATTTVAEGGGRATLTPDTNTTNKYRYIMLVVNKVQGSRSSVDINEIKYYGYEEGSGSLDTTLKSVYNVPATTGTQLEVYYDAKDLADGAVTSVADLSPNSNGGLPSDNPQVSNGAFVFDGVNDYIYNSQSGFTGGKTYTGSAWIKKTSNTNGCVFQFGNGSNGNSFGIFYYGGSIDYIRAYVFGYVLANSTSGSIPLNEWIHVTGVYSDKTATLYINGIEVATHTGSTSITIPSTPYLTLGTQTDNTNTPYAGTYFNGSIANFRLYSKALNADQVKELYDYQKDYFLGSKSQVTLYKGHLGLGVAEPSGQLELAGDERLQEYPPRALTGYSTHIEGHGVFGLHHTPGTGASGAVVNAFNKSATTADFWYSTIQVWTPGGQNVAGPFNYTGTHSIAGISGEWVYITLPYHVNMKYLQITARNGEVGSAPNSAIIIGSSDGGRTWEQVGSWSDKTSSNFWLDGGVPSPTFTINSTKPLNAIGFVVTEANSWYAFTLGEIKFFGTPGPTTLDKGSLTLGRSLDVPRVSRYDVDTETPRPEKLVVDFDTTVNSSPTDISGQGNHGVFKGTASYSAVDKAFKFDGAGATYIYRSGASGIPSGDAIYSIVGWVNVEPSITTFGQLLTFGSAWGVSTIGALCVNTSYGFQASIGGDVVKSPDGVITPNTWHHIAAVKVATGVCTVDTYDLYLDGVSITSKTYSGSNRTQNIGTGTKYLSVGGGFTGAVSDPFDGLISNPKLYNVALEPSEVQKLYRLGRTGRSMVISDTAVGIGKVPEAQLDVRGDLRVGGRLLASVPYYSARQRNTQSYVFDESIVYDQYVYTNYPGSFVANSGSDGYYQPPMNGMYQVHMECIANGSGNLHIQRLTNGTVDISHDDRHINYTHSGWMSTGADALIPITNHTTQTIRIYFDGNGGDGIWQYNTYHGSAFFLWVSDIPEGRQHHVA